jgi:cardiolipin synthase
MSEVLGGLFLGVVILLTLVVWSIRRHRDPDLHIECDSPIDELMPTLSGLTLGTALAGNKAEVHENGAFFDVVIGRIITRIVHWTFWGKRRARPAMAGA